MATRRGDGVRISLRSPGRKGREFSFGISVPIEDALREAKAVGVADDERLAPVGGGRNLTDGDH